ncbi:MAG TPA: carbamoyltransferase HypF [Terriglobales bacterium]|nr:carbamoyltransferase HypF [Terriglobales bacterium]
MPARSHSSLTRWEIQVHGIVQGVGFRPFIYKLANSLGLAGYVLNSSAGVIIEVEGDEVALYRFLERLKAEAPPLSAVEETSVSQLNPSGGNEFFIRESLEQSSEFALISPDVATCEDCWRELSDATNRRFLYPFTNCTNCGPRYTIVQDIPYDRRTTTMATFAMCADCEREYRDPGNRRFHAQPNACAVCGPGLALVESGERLPLKFEAGRSAEVLREARRLLREGKILAVKGLGGFLLACDAEHGDAVQELRKRKRRSDKPFALMARDLDAVQRFCMVSDADRDALRSLRRPIVVLPRRPGSSISAHVAPGNNTVGVMLPYTPLHYLLFGDSEVSALVMTSGNLSEEPIVVSNDEALRQLEKVADWFVLHNRDIYMRADDSVVRTFRGRGRVLRRSRGFVPQPVDLGIPVHEILACGAELKNTFCLTKGHYAILSQHIGDFENYETLQFFQETLGNLKRLFRVGPQAVAYDLHPRYMSSRFAQSLPIERKIGVQHHHAHIASCLAENHLQGDVIGVAFDGTGFGTDGQIWGGEFLTAGLASFKRRAHLRYVSLPGGDAAVRQPWRMALSYLRDTFGNSGLCESVAFLRQTPEKQIALVDAMLARGIHSIQTSSCGRLFDAVAALIGLRTEVNFEGQAAIELEAIACHDVTQQYPFRVEDGAPAQIDLRPMVEAIVHDLARSTAISHIAARFHNTLSGATIEMCRRVRDAEALNRVCLSGGTFQNHYLLDRVVTGLSESGFEVFLHSVVPANDGGISLGQAVIANEILQNGAPHVSGNSR